MDIKECIENRYLVKEAPSKREDADYHYSYSGETAESSLRAAEEFVGRMKVLAK